MFNKLVTLLSGKSQEQRLIARTVGHLLQGKWRCTECSRQYPLANADPLTMINCPKCGSLNLVPMRIGNFWLVEPLGGGGMGAVYKGYHQKHQEWH